MTAHSQPYCSKHNKYLFLIVCSIGTQVDHSSKPLYICICETHISWHCFITLTFFSNGGVPLCLNLPLPKGVSVAFLGQEAKCTVPVHVQRAMQRKNKLRQDSK